MSSKVPLKLASRQNILNLHGRLFKPISGPMKRLLGLDVGTAFVGVAVTDSLNLSVQPLGTIQRKVTITTSSPKPSGASSSSQQPLYSLQPNQRQAIVPPSQVAASIQSLVDQYSIEALIVGLPVHFDPSKPQIDRSCLRVGKFIDELQAHGVRTPVLFEDESFSTVEALKNNTNRKKAVQEKDEQAAVLILSNFLARLHSIGGKPSFSFQAPTMF